MGPIWGRQDPGGPHVGAMNLAVRATKCRNTNCNNINDMKFIVGPGTHFSLTHYPVQSKCHARPKYRYIFLHIPLSCHVQQFVGSLQIESKIGFVSHLNCDEVLVK